MATLTQGFSWVRGVDSILVKDSVLGVVSVRRFLVGGLSASGERDLRVEHLGVGGLKWQSPRKADLGVSVP